VCVSLFAQKRPCFPQIFFRFQLNATLSLRRFTAE
jgi:hypothetical protein